jgi:hypothetical protein
MILSKKKYQRARTSSDFRTKIREKIFDPGTNFRGRILIREPLFTDGR